MDFIFRSLRPGRDLWGSRAWRERPVRRGMRNDPWAPANSSVDLREPGANQGVWPDGNRSLTANRTFSAEQCQEPCKYLSGGGGRASGGHRSPWPGPVVRVGGEMGRPCLRFLEGGLVSCIPVRDLQ